MKGAGEGVGVGEGKGFVTTNELTGWLSNHAVSWNEERLQRMGATHVAYKNAAVSEMRGNVY